MSATATTLTTSKRLANVNVNNNLSNNNDPSLKSTIKLKETNRVKSSVGFGPSMKPKLPTQIQTHTRTNTSKQRESNCQYIAPTQQLNGENIKENDAHEIQLHNELHFDLTRQRLARSGYSYNRGDKGDTKEGTESVITGLSAIENSRYTTEVQQSIDKLEIVQQEKEEALREMTKSTQQISELRSQIASLTSELKIFREKDIASDEVIREYAKSQATLVKEIESLNKTIAGMHETIANLNNQIATLNVSVNNKQHEADTARLETANTRATLLSVTADNTNYKRMLSLI